MTPSPRLWYHVLGWTLFIGYELFFVMVAMGISIRSPLNELILPYLLCMALFYVHAGYTMTLCFGGRRKHILLFVLMSVIELAAYVFLIDLFSQQAGARSYFTAGHTIRQLQPLLLQIFRGLQFMILGLIYWLVLRSYAQRRHMVELEKLQLANLAEKSRLEKNLVETENAYLRAQINPHLLFNTLNFIYNKVQQVSVKASEAVLRLSDLMNYSLREPDPDGKIALEKEIEQIQHLVRINQLRFEDRIWLDVQEKGDYQDARIIPLSILVFVENLFKHGDLTDAGNPGRISICYEDGRLQLHTVNQKKKRLLPQTHGTGLVNIKKRLEKAYGDRYSLDIRNEETLFMIQLSVDLNMPST